MGSFGLETAAILFAVAVAAGWIDSIAGGGGLLAVPALLWTGMPPLLALGTNKLQASFGSFMAAYHFCRHGLADPRRLRLPIALTFLGATLGTWLVQRIDNDFLAALIPALLIGFALYFAFSPRLSDADAHSRIRPGTFAVWIGTSVGFYDGFFGPGTGSLFAIAYIALLGFNLRKATAHTKVLNFTSNIASLLAFAISGNLIWEIGLLMATGQLIGARIGSGMVMHHGARLIRPMLIFVSLSISLKLLYNAYT
jgi:uncharacterized membrane protein YfcA